MRPAARLIVVLAFSLLASLAASGQGVTSSGLGGIVYGTDGAPAAGVEVRAVHDPSGTVFSARTNSDGQYRISGMRVGGPYSISYEGRGAQSAAQDNVYLSLQQERVINVRLREVSEQVFELDAIEVVSSELGTIFNETKQGSGSVISAADLNRLPTVDRSLNDIVRLDPRMSVFDRDNGTVSAGGKNFRYNTLLIDGVPTNDSFGLSASGLPALKQPFSLESISEISVQLSPYTVENAGFTGASISAVTKSGTNQFRGSVFGFYRNTDMVGDLYDSYLELGQTEPDLVPFQDFIEYTAGFTMGGPIIKNKLFFFLLYEKVEETVTSDPGDYFPRQDELDGILAMMPIYNFDPGSLDQPGDQRKIDDKYLIKLDWNITDQHRMTARYQLTKGVEPNYPDYSGENQIAFSSRFYDETFELDDITTELFSRWSSTFQTEALVSFKQYKQDREPYAHLPSIEIGSVNGIDGNPGSVFIGTEPNSQYNTLQVDTTVARLKGIWLLGDHQIKAGVQYEQYDNLNAFIPRYYGDWFFRNGVAASWQLAVSPGKVETYSIQRPAEGSTGIADWSMAIASAFLEDNWLISTRFNLNLGLRIDYPLMSDRPLQARGSVADDPRSFEEIFGDDNAVTVDGNYVIQPRIGFNYALDEERKTQIRGGGGLFFGTAPHVWISSIFINNGRSQEFFRASTYQTPAFSADVENPPIPTAVNSRVNVDYLDEGFKMPTEWKANFAVDRKLFADIALTLEASLSKTQYDIHYIHQNLKQQPAGFLTTGFLPDGRTIYANQEALQREDGYRNVIKLTNTTMGEGQQYTAMLQRPVKDGWGFRAGYTNTRARNVNDGQSQTASSNWTSNVAFNPNDEILGRSRYETTHRFIASGTYEISWTKKHKTSLTLVYEGRSGRPFSFMFGRDRGSIDMNRDTNASNDLVYVPSGIDDPLVAWGDQRNSGRDTLGVLFMEFVERTDGLRQYKGQVVPRNSGTAPWIHQLDLNITHEIITWNNQKLEFIFAIENLTNLLNDEWGREKRPRGGFVPIVKAGTQPARGAPEGKGGENGYYVYSPTEIDLDPANWYEVRNFSSRWAMQVGVRYSF